MPNELTEQQAKAKYEFECRMAKLLVGLLIDQGLAFDYSEPTDYITIDPRCVQEMSCVQLIDMFDIECEQFEGNRFVMKHPDWSEDAYFEVFDLSEPRRHISKRDPNAKRGGEIPAVLISFRKEPD